MITRDQAKELLPVIKAFAEGKKIQYRHSYDGWIDVKENEGLSFIKKPLDYRIKPQPKYRPFKTQEECWNEMLKHQPFGWIKSKGKGYFHLIDLVRCVSELEGVMITFATSERLARSSRSIYEHYIFADGTPFGVKEEE